MKNLLVEIGNTALKAAESEGTTLGKIFRYQGERPLEYMQSIIRKVRPETLTVASAAEISEEEEVFYLFLLCFHYTFSLSFDLYFS